jgi:hypothetical protein
MEGSIRGELAHWKYEANLAVSKGLGAMWIRQKETPCGLTKG